MLSRRRVLQLGSCAVAYAALGRSSFGDTLGTVSYPGVNLAGGEFGTGDRYGWDYIYPSEKQVAYYASRGFKLLRIPFKSSRLIVNNVANMLDINMLKTVIAAAQKRGMTVVLDMHEFALRPDGQPLTDLDAAAFRRKWRVIAPQFRIFPNVWFGLMNEPHLQTPEQWFRLANAGIAGIREVAPLHYITVMGSRWGSADGWITSGNAAAVPMLSDPSHRLIIEMHQYLDNAGGNTAMAAVAGVAATGLEAATAWAREKGWKLFLGEFASTTDPAYLDETRTLLRYMYANSDVWLAYAYWAGGLWWAEGRSTYAYSIEPASLDYPVDRPQMLMLREFTQPAPAI
jgi:endoglucanase